MVNFTTYIINSYFNYLSFKKRFIFIRNKEITTRWVFTEDKSIYCTTALRRPVITLFVLY